MDLHRRVIGNADPHWMYDLAAMMIPLESHSFTGIRRASFYIASDPIFDLVEEKGRFADSETDELAIDARWSL